MIKRKGGISNYIYSGLMEQMHSLLAPLQIRAAKKMVKARGGLVWWKVGEGKTRIGLFTFALLQNIFKWNLPSICLVVCRRRAFYDWREEIVRCFPSSHVYEDQIPSYPPSRQPVFLLVSHAMLEKSQEELINNGLIRFVILDEGWLYTNHKAKRFKAAHAVTEDRISIVLSGTIMKARDTCEIFCQTAVIHKNEYLARSISAFKGQYQKSTWIEAGGFPIKRPKKGAYRKIMGKLRDIADVHFPKGDRIVTEQYHTVPATVKQLQYFDELRECYSIDDLGLEYSHAIVIGVKAQQIANGWVKDSSGKIVHIPTLKPEKLEEELSDIIASGERAVVWCAFRYDVEMLVDRLKIASVQMLGGEDFDIDKWNSGKFKLCLATQASGSSVNYFAQTPYAIYYSANYKWLDMQQSRGRTDRGKASRHRECFYKYLQVEGSLDAHVYQTAMESGAAESKLIGSVSSWLKKK